MTLKSLLLGDKDPMRCKGMFVSGDGETSVVGTNIYLDFSPQGMVQSSYYV